MDLGCLPRSWGGGPTSAQASLCPSYPTAATLGLVVRMEHRQGGRRQAGFGEESHQPLAVGGDEGEGGGRHLLRRIALRLEASWFVLNRHLRFRKE